jgi:tetratricopeptide (TPR) repeat protein
MLHFLVTHVRVMRGNLSAGVLPDSKVVRAEAHVSLSGGAPSRPGEPDLAATDASTARQEVAESIISPIVRNACWMLTAIILPAGSTGCACLHRDKVDANVVSARQLSLRGVDAIQHGQWEDAEQMFTSALEKNPADERAHRHIAEVFWHRGQQDLAIRHQEESVRLSGGDPALLVELGEMYFTQGNQRAAAECAAKAIESNHQLPAAWALRGDILRQRSEPEEALQCYHRALNLQPHYPQVQLALADLYAQSNRPRRALATLDSLASRYPPESVPVEICYQRGLAYKALGRYQDAVETLSQAAERSDPSSELLYHLGEAQLLAGNLASARLAAQALLAKSPTHAGGQWLQESVERHNRAMTAALERP